MWGSPSNDGKPTESTSLKGPKVSVGPKDLEDRKCTDFMCLAFFAGFWVVMLSLMGYVYAAGDVNKVFYGTDYMGNTCGQTANTTGRTKVWYPRIGSDVAEQASELVSGYWWDINLYGVCVEHCPTYHANRVDRVHDYGYGQSAEAHAANWPVYMSTVDLFNRCLQQTQSQQTSIELCALPTCTQVGAPCYSLGVTDIDVPQGAWALNGATPNSLCSREVVFSYGAQVRQPGANAYLDWLFESVGTLKDTWESIHRNGGVIVGFGVGMSLVVNFGWLILLYLFAKIAVWTCIAAILVGEFLSAIFCFIKAGAVSTAVAAVANSNITSISHLSANVTTGVSTAINTYVQAAVAADQWMWWAGGICLTIIFLLTTVFMCCSCKAIGRCIVLVEQGSSALGASMGLAVFPIFIAALQFVVVLVVGLSLLVLTTVGNDTPYHLRINGTSATTRDAIIGTYFLFGGLWSYAFLQALTMMVVAGCIFYFYFVNKKTVPAEAYMAQYDDNQTSTPVITHLKWVLRYHIGTLAFGSLIVATVTLIQIACKAFFTYLENNAPGNNPASFMLKLVSNCVQCCLWCFKKTVEFINSYAYIYCFVENVGFCNGCMKSFQLMVRYPAQITINTSVQFVLSTLLTLTTPLVCGVCAFTYFDFLADDANSHLSTGGMMLPGTVAVLALLMSRAFASVWEQVIQSLTVCVLLDVDTFDGRFLRESMKDAFGSPEKNTSPPPDQSANEEGLVSQ